MLMVESNQIERLKKIAYKIAKRQSFLDCAISQVETRLRG